MSKLCSSKTCELYYRFGSFLAPLSVGLITSRHYLSECNINGEQTSAKEEMRKQPSRLDVIETVLIVRVLGFWFGIGATFGTKIVNSLEELISR